MGMLMQLISLIYQVCVVLSIAVVITVLVISMWGDNGNG